MAYFFWTWIAFCFSSIATLSVSLALAAGQPQADAMTVLCKASDVYRNASSFEFSGELTTRFPGVPGTLYVQFHGAEAGPSFVLADSPVPMYPLAMRFGGGGFLDDTGLPNPQPKHGGVVYPSEYFELTRIHTHVKQADVMPPEELVIGARRMKCHVVRVVYEGFPRKSSRPDPVTYWIEQGTHLIRRIAFVADSLNPKRDEKANTTEEIAKPLRWTATFMEVTLNQPPPDWLVRFTTDRRGGPDASWQGRPAPDFILSDLNGSRVRLSELRGQAVLLNFWATWCGPCREEMPVIERLKAEFHDQGLQTWGVTQGTTAETKEWLKENQRNLPTLVDESGNVFKSYAVKGIPVTLTVNRSGKVSSYFVGLCGESELREAVKKALKE